MGKHKKRLPIMLRGFSMTERNLFAAFSDLPEVIQWGTESKSASEPSALSATSSDLPTFSAEVELSHPRFFSFTSLCLAGS